MKKILLVEDEAHVVSFIKKGLSEEGFEVSVAFDGKMGLQLFQNNQFDLIVLDIMLPEINGLDLCKEIRKENTFVPVLFLTALGTSENIVMGLENGADDYMIKPFKFIEFVARIKTLLRRADQTQISDLEVQKDYVFTFDNLKLNDYTKEVFRGSEQISLTTTEYKLLYYFVRDTNRVLSRMDILEAVWSVDYDLGTNVVDVYVNYLRKKVDTKPDEKIIQTIMLYLCLQFGVSYIG
jgi:DNA-binding response OmpR family regulator